MSSTTGHLPHANIAQEIIENVLDSTDVFDEQTPLTCAFVSRIWCKAARRITFRSVECDPKTPKFVALQGILCSPLQTVGWCVRELTIKDGPARKRKPIRLAELRIVLENMPHLQKLTLSHVDVVSDDDSIDGAAQKFPLPSLKKLTVTSCGFRRSSEVIKTSAFASLLMLFSGLDRLALDAPEDDAEDAAALVISPSIPSTFVKRCVRKATLKWELSQHVARLLGRYLQEDQVHSLRLKHFSVTHSIVDRLRSNVRCLSLSMPDDCPGKRMIFPLFCLSSGLTIASSARPLSVESLGEIWLEPSL